MTPIQKRLIDLRRCLDKILEAPLESETSIKAQVTQSLILDKNGAEALAALSQDIDGNVFLIQAAQINAQVIRNSAKALRYLTKIEQLYAEQSVALDQALEELVNKGWKFGEIEKLVKEKCFKLALVNNKNIKAAAARQLGIKRTTLHEALDREGISLEDDEC